MTDTTKKPMTSEQFEAMADALTRSPNCKEAQVNACRALRAVAAQQREDVFEDTYHGVLLSKMVDMLRNNEWAELFTGEQVIADLQAEIARLVATQREGEPAAFDFDEWEAWFSGIGVEDRVILRLVSRLSWQEAMRKYAQPRAAVTVTEEDVELAIQVSLDFKKKEGECPSDWKSWEKADEYRKSMRAALEAVLKGK